MKGKKIVSLLCTAAVSVSMLAGCGSSAASTASTTPQSSAAATSEAQSSAAAGTAAGSTAAATTTAASGSYDTQAIENAGDITITMMVSGTATDNDFETDQLPALVKQKWPNVTLEVTKLPDDNYYTSLKTKLASGECPDIILVQPMYAGSNACYSLADAGYLTPLNDMSAISKLGDVSALTYKDNTYAISAGVSILGTYYNKDIFSKAGITAEPTTWDEFLSDCQKIKDAGYQPIVMGDKDQYVLQFGLYQLACSEIYADNKDYDNQLRSGDASFTDQGTWDHVLEMYKTLYDKGYIDAKQSLGLSASQAITEFVDGKAAMTFDGSFNATALLAKGAGGDFERGYFPLPGDKGTTYTATCRSAGYGVYSGSKYQDACKELLDYWFDGQSPVWDAYLATGKIIATYGNGADSFPNYALFKPFIDLLNQGKADHWCNQAWPAGTETVMEEMFSEMVGGQGTTVADITQGMQDKFEDLLDE